MNPPAPRRTFVDTSGRFWRTLPGLPTVVARVEPPTVRTPLPLTHTLSYATTCYGLTALEA